jgi:tryptophanyl-tRNA synthetase
MKTVFSGIQPSGNLHIGNYIGAISQWVAMQKDYDSIFCVVDLHAITVPQDPKILREKVLEVTALYIACGIDPQKSHIFIQSENPNHSYLTWILNCFTSMGQLKRMTQYKDKGGANGAQKELKNYLEKILNQKISEMDEQYKSLEQTSFTAQMHLTKQDIIKEVLSASEKAVEDFSSVGLFDYPVLMASDILLYQTDEVPVGEDQKQHVELTRDIAEKFNSKFGEIFKLPNPMIQKETARIMSLQSPTSKMSKSDKNLLGTINLLDTEEMIREKIKKAVTDSEPVISGKAHGQGSGAVQNLLTIYSVFSGYSYNIAVQKVQGRSYGEFKQDLANLLVEKLKPIQEKYYEIRNNEQELRRILDEGRDFAISKSSKTLEEVKQKVGLA